MKQLFILVLFGLLVSTQVEAKRIHVYQGATGDGSSWEYAYGDLQTALYRAVAGDEIWVAAGIYYPTQQLDRTASFVIPKGVKLFGGFNGTERNLEERNWERNITILSGEIGSPLKSEDNSYTVVYFNGVGNDTWLDGFTIKDGYANSHLQGAFDMTNCGGGVFNDASVRESSPIIQHCTFFNNFARQGAAIFNYSGHNTCAPIIRACAFRSNHATFNGGAIFTSGNSGVCSPAIISCTFNKNQANYGAAVFIQANLGQSQTRIERCHFNANFAVVRGASYYEDKSSNSSIHTIDLNNAYQDNVSVSSAGLNEMPNASNSSRNAY